MKKETELMYTQKMNEAVKQRLDSDAWDFFIASKVIDARNSERENRMNIWSLASLATAAVSFIIFMTGIFFTTMESRNYKSTGSIYSYAYIENASNLNNDVIAARLELTINEAYPMR